MKYKFLLSFTLPFTMMATKHHELWTKLYLEKRIAPKWSVGFDVQHRLQSDYYNSELNPIDYRLLDNVRLWLNYKMGKGTVVYSPFAWFRNYELDPNGFTHKKDEWRMAIGYQHQHNFNKIENAGRFLYEHRQIPKDDIGIDRLRAQIRIRPLVFKGGRASTQPYFQEEYFYRINGENSTFDQNRFQIGLKYKKKGVDISLAYQNTIHKPLAWIYRHQAYIAIQYSIE